MVSLAFKLCIEFRSKQQQRKRARARSLQEADRQQQVLMPEKGWLPPSLLVVLRRGEERRVQPWP